MLVITSQIFRTRVLPRIRPTMMMPWDEKEPSPHKRLVVKPIDYVDPKPPEIPKRRPSNKAAATHEATWNPWRRRSESAVTPIESGDGNDTDPDSGPKDPPTCSVNPTDIEVGAEEPGGDTKVDCRQCCLASSRQCCRALSDVRAVLRDSYTAIFGESPDATDAFNKVIKRKWVVAIFLLVVTLLQVFDTVSDILVTVGWSFNDQQGRRSYATISVFILIVHFFGGSLVIFLMGMHLVPLAYVRRVLPFSLLNLNVVLWAVLIWLDVWNGRMEPEDVFGTKDMNIDFFIVDGSHNAKSLWKYTKVLEFILEAAPEITLQSYVAAFEFFNDGITPSVLLQLSITVSVLSIVAGLSTSYLCYETLKVQIWATCFFAGALIARIAICAFAFVEFGRFAMIFVAIVVALRLGIFAYMSAWTLFADVADFFGDGEWLHNCIVFATAYVIIPIAPTVIVLPALVIEMIVPLGLRNNSNNSRNTVFWGSVDRSRGYKNIMSIAFFGDHKDAQGVRSRLTSPVAYIMIALYCVENFIMMVIVAVEPHRAQRAKVGDVPLVAFVVVPMLAAAASYYMVHVTTKDLEDKWTKALEAIVKDLEDGNSPLLAGFVEKEMVLEGLFGDDKTATVTKCKELIQRIHNGELDDPNARRALDLLLLGNARLRV